MKYTLIINYVIWCQYINKDILRKDYNLKWKIKDNSDFKERQKLSEKIYKTRSRKLEQFKTTLFASRTLKMYLFGTTLFGASQSLPSTKAVIILERWFVLQNIPKELLRSWFWQKMLNLSTIRTRNMMEFACRYLITIQKVGIQLGKYPRLSLVCWASGSQMNKLMGVSGITMRLNSL